VPPVGDEGERLVGAAGAHQVEPEEQVHHPRAQHHRHPQVEGSQGDAHEQALDDLVDDQHRGERDEATLEGRAQELHLAVPVRVVPVGGAAREDERSDGEHRGHHVDDGLERVGEDRGGAGQPVGVELRGEEPERHHQGDRNGEKPDAMITAARRRGSRHGPPFMVR
jgi:hypothetical protein